MASTIDEYVYDGADELVAGEAEIGQTFTEGDFNTRAECLCKTSFQHDSSRALQPASTAMALGFGWSNARMAGRSGCSV